MRFLLSIGSIACLMFMLCPCASGQQSPPLFEYLSDDDGLPQNHVFHVTQDTDGFMWFSTMGGLSKYDGFTFTNYFHREGDSTTLTSSYINAFFQDSKGRCWVVTPNGFNAWDRLTGKARRFYHDPLIENSLGHNHTRAILEDRDGYLWIARQKGLDRFDPQTSGFEHFDHEQYGVARHSGSLAIDSKGNIWALGTEGLFKINRDQHKLEFIIGLPPSKNYPPHEGRDLMIDSRDRIWIGYKSGFGLLDVAKNEYELFDTGPFAKGVIKMLEYDSKTLAIATGRSGLVLWDIESRTVKSHYIHSPFDELSIRGETIYSMYIDRFRNIWLGLFYGISMANLETERFRFIRHAQGFANYANFILRVYKDSQGGVWSNTMDGLYYQRSIDSQAYAFIREPQFPSGYTPVSGIAGDEKGNVFLGVRGVGLYQYSYRDEKLRQLEDNTKLDLSGLLSLHLDVRDKNTLWICTTNGICRFDLTTRDTLYIRPSTTYPHLRSNLVSRVTQDPDGNLYFINSGKLFRLPYAEITPDTLPGKLLIEGTIHGIDISGHLVWIGSHEAVYRYDLQQKQCVRISTQNGNKIKCDGLAVDQLGTVWVVGEKHVTRIQDDQVWQYRSPTGFVNGIGTEAADGQLIFGGDKGIIAIDPQAFYMDTSHPAIFFCGIDVANKKRILPLEPEYIREIELAHEDKVFTLHYAAPHFIHREGLTYKYQLVGFDKEWIDAGTHRAVTYTNLPHGTYTFKATAISEDQLTSLEPLHIVIQINPPFYKTTWFYSIIAILSACLLYLLYLLRQKASSLQKEKMLAEQQAAYKSMFLANMSHEIRTPLNAIIGLNTLLSQTPLNEKQTEYAKAISASCDNLLWIVNDILDQSKIESGTYSIETKPFDLKAILHQLEVLFRHVAKEKNLELTFSRQGMVPDTLIGDPVRLIQILSNLLSNAIKFTDKGSIRLITKVKENDARHVICLFTITDTGIGIPADKVNSIFESFQQVNEKVIAGNQGTGLGLSIVKYLVDKMGGEIQLRSTHGTGSEFIVTLPFQVNLQNHSAVSSSEPDVTLRPGLRILLVEDAPLNQLVATELILKWVHDPVITLAENGVDAIAKIQDKSYDVILMDVKMPVMDGLEATRRIRAMEDLYFKTIPIAGLTANVIPQQIEECLNAGMNAFISKPIQQKDFLLKLSTLIPA